MATNLRLNEKATSALRDASLRTGRSQQDIIRAAVDNYLGLGAMTGSALARSLVDL